MTRILDIHPAFGFETEDRWEIAVHQRDEQLRERGKDPSQYFHRTWGKERMFLNDSAKALAVILGVHIIVGIVGLVFALTDDTQDPVKKEIRDKHVVRWALTIFLGPVLTIIDIVQTCLDYEVMKEYMEKHPDMPRRGFYLNLSQLTEVVIE